MAGLRITIDPDAAPLELSEANGYNLLSPLRQVPAPLVPQWASGIATEGERSSGGKRGNTQLIPRVRISGASEALFRQAQLRLQQKLYKLEQEGGVLRVHMPDDSYIDWHVRAVECGERLIDNRYVHRKRTEGEITFVCAPFGIGQEELVGTFTFSGDPERVLSVVIEDVGGTAPALARAVLTSPDEDVWWLRWGKESRHYSEAATALPYYAAADLTPAPDSTVTTFNGEPAVQSPTLRSEWEEILSTEISGVGHMTHEGVVAVYAWIAFVGLSGGATSTSSEVRLEYSRGDWARATALRSVQAVNVDAGLTLVPLGEVRLGAGEADDWRGRIVGRRSAGAGPLYAVGLGVLPVGEGNARIETARPFDTPRNVLVKDNFPNDSSGNLNGKALAKGGSWSTGGDATDFTINTTDRVAQRSEVNDLAGAGRYALAGAATYGLVAVQFDFRATSMQGVKIAARARHVDASSHLTVGLWGIGAGVFLLGASVSTSFPFVAQRWYTLRLLVDHAGRYFLWVFPAGGFPGNPLAAHHHPGAVPGGSLETGLVGFYDEHLSPTPPSTRQYRNFIVFEPVVDAAVFAGRSLELSHDRVRRESQNGGVWTPKTHRGDFLTVPPSGLENRQTRFVFLPHLDEPTTMPARDPADLSVDVYLTPRYQNVPPVAG